MQFVTIGTPRPGAGATQAREGLRMSEKFASWQPPEGVAFDQLLIAPDGRTFAVVSADSLEPIMEAAAQWSTISEAEVVPVLPAEVAVEASRRGLAWALQGSDWATQLSDALSEVRQRVAEATGGGAEASP